MSCCCFQHMQNDITKNDDNMVDEFDSNQYHKYLNE
jgi:hypothetical protein